MSFRKKHFIWLGILFSLSVILLLLPSPRNWGVFGAGFSRSYDRMSAMLQPSAHFFIMAACAFILMGLFSQRKLGVAVFFAVSITACAAIGLEILQSFLPVHFARKCDPFDLIPSLLGALAGSASGWVARALSVDRKQNDKQ